MVLLTRTNTFFRNAQKLEARRLAKIFDRWMLFDGDNEGVRELIETILDEMERKGYILKRTLVLN